MSELLIQPVSNSLEKATTYRLLKTKYKKALSQEFFFEALAIDYGVIEDRLRAFLYRIGGLNTRLSLKLDNKTTKNFLISLYSDYKMKKQKGLSIRNIDTKINLIRSVVKWSVSSEKSLDDYQAKLRQICQALPHEEMQKCLDKLENWCKYRNEITHGLMNKNYDCLFVDISANAIEGMNIANTLDSYVSIISKQHVLRRFLKLKTE